MLRQWNFNMSSGSHNCTVRLRKTQVKIRLDICFHLSDRKRFARNSTTLICFNYSGRHRTETKAPVKRSQHLSQNSLNIVESRCWGRLTPPLNIVETCWDMLRRVWIRLNFVSTSSQHFFCSRNVEAVWHALSTLLNTRKRSNLVPRLVRKSLGTRLAQQDGDRGRAGSGSPSQTSRSSFVERMLRPFDTARSQHLSTCLNNVERMLRQMLWPCDRGLKFDSVLLLFFIYFSMVTNKHSWDCAMRPF